ncbi:methionyl-tRNA formyltransferase [Spirulina major]|uniref:methionyl-tRNA formyltransferase n=1 Tax=Spirulina major TaxID=270636 RepID=UPI0009324429|nr:methionyl-tRNA formyltransferase [Spirulina major]
MLKLVFFGTPEFAVPSLKRLIADPDFDVAAVVTQPDKPRGRGKRLIPSPVKAAAEAAALPVWQPRRIKKDAPTLDHLRSLNADAFVVVAYGQILSTEILKMPRLGCVNGHGSLLPAYRGAAPIQWSICNGETVTGMTTMLMDAGMDTGPMLLTSQVPIGLLDNAQTMMATLADDCADLLVKTLPGLATGAIAPIPQDDTLATYAPLLKKADFQLDWAGSAIALHNQIRGFYPNCVTPFRNTPLKILATVPLLPDACEHLPPEFQPLQAQIQDLPPSAPGTVVKVIKKYGPVVQTGSGLLLLRELQPAGKRVQSGWDFANGMRVQAGDRFSMV